MNYTYPSSVGSNEVRLLRPVSADHRTLHFTVLSVSRVAAPPYTAVSYTWGDEKASEIIYLNRRAFYVRPNLWSCLYYLSLGTHNAAWWKYIWVDAICINQNHDTERNAQVRLMDQTYRDAACVSVWLGLVTPPEIYMAQWPKSIPIKTIDTDGFDWREAIADLANRPYWSRFWVIQEFLLGRHVVLYCSGNVIQWDDFKTILCDEAGIDEFSIEYGKNSTHGALPLVMARHIDKHPEILQPLHSLLIDHRSSKCKDPRDRVFALLGLIPLDERDLLGRFFPDYTITEDHVLIITLAHLMHFDSLSRLKTITPDSEELFLGLEIDSKVQRRRLLRRAKDFPYLDLGTSSELLQILAFHDEIKEYQNSDLEKAWEIEETEPPRSGGTRRLRRFMLFVGLALGLIALWLSKSG